MPDAYVLSQADKNALKEMHKIVSEYNKLPKNKTGRYAPDLTTTTAPDTYIARTPEWGIPALTETPDTGTGTTALLDDEPGSAECDIYRMLETDGVTNLYPLGDVSRVVYNIGTKDIAGNIWVLISRDKFGNWFVSYNPGTEIGVVTSLCTVFEDVEIDIDNIDGGTW